MDPVLWVCPGKEHILIYQDESTFHVNEYPCCVWFQEGQQPLRKKGNGRSIHVSDFVTEKGRLALTEEEEKENGMCLPEARVKSDACCRHDNRYPWENQHPQPSLCGRLGQRGRRNISW